MEVSMLSPVVTQFSLRKTKKKIRSKSLIHKNVRQQPNFN